MVGAASVVGGAWVVGAVVGACWVVTVSTTVVPGSVTVSLTVRGAVVAATFSSSPPAEQRRGEDPGDEQAAQEHEQQRQPPALPTHACRRDRAHTSRPGGAVERVAKRVDEVRGRAEAMLRILREPACEHVVDLRWQLRVRVGGRRDRRAHVRHRLGGGALSPERPLPRQQLERDDGEGVAVAGRGGALAARLLGSEIAGRTDDGSRLGVGGEVGRARDAEVGDLDPVVVVEQEVARLDVAVDDPVRVRGVECGRGLAQPLERSADGLRSAALEPVGERAAGEVLHDDVGPPLVIADVEDGDRAGGVREPRDGERLAGEAPANRLVVRVAVGEHLDRDDPRQVGILGAIHLAHAAAGDALGVPVALWETALVHFDRVPPSGQSKTRRRVLCDLKVR